MSLFPYFQLQVGEPPGGVQLTTVPPNFLRSLSYLSSIHGVSTLSFTAVDPTYTTLEELLITSDTGQRPLFARFGYLDRSGQVSSEWVQARLMQFNPRLTDKGMEISATALISSNDAIVEIKGKTYSGKRSQVVQQVADDLSVDTEIEETDDDINLVSEDGSPQLWSTKNYTPIEFLNNEIVPQARSKTSTSEYVCYLVGSRRRSKKPILHFHTRDYPLCSARGRLRMFTYLLGRQDEVKSFTPQFNSSLLGKIGSGNLVMRSYDPTTKQFVTRANNLLTNSDQESVGTGDRSNAAIPVEDPTDTSVSTGVDIVRERTPEDSLARSRNLWSKLFASSFTAELVLVGLPSTCDVEANELVQITVMVPAQGPLGYKVHWSSGVYLIREANHEIDDSGYLVTCSLQRDRSTFGIEAARSLGILTP